MATDSPEMTTRSPEAIERLKKSREGEQIGGGFFVFRRGRRSNRVWPSKLPFEHPSLAAALAERDRLAALFPDRTFVVLAQVG